jgi:hypothetical protein
MLFAQINNIEFQSQTFWHIFDHEKEPLIVSLGVDIIL